MTPLQEERDRYRDALARIEGALSFRCQMAEIRTPANPTLDFLYELLAVARAGLEGGRSDDRA